MSSVNRVRGAAKNGGASIQRRFLPPNGCNFPPRRVESTMADHGGFHGGASVAASAVGCCGRDGDSRPWATSVGGRCRITMEGCRAASFARSGGALHSFGVPSTAALPHCYTATLLHYCLRTQRQRDMSRSGADSAHELVVHAHVCRTGCAWHTTTTPHTEPRRSW